jgi:ABC-2 type transport system ATP-binding protein
VRHAPTRWRRRGPRRSAEPEILCEGVTKSFAGTAVVRDLSFAVHDRTIVGLIGPSGCGKTTTVRLLTGVYEPSAGTVRVRGRTPHRLSRRDRRAIGYLPQLPALFPDLSVWENVNFHASMYGVRLGRHRRLREVLRWVELWDDRHKRVRQVSGGMQRRLALAATLVHDPQLIFLDEPTAGIDPILRAKFWDRFRELRDAGRTLVVTTQYVAEAVHCDVVGLLSDGELLLLDTPDNLRRAAFGGDLLDVTTSSPLGDDLLHDLAAVPGVVDVPERTGYRSVRVVVEHAGTALPRLHELLQERDVEVLEAQEHPVAFDEVFVRVIERHRRMRAATGKAA